MFKLLKRHISTFYYYYENCLLYLWSHTSNFDEIAAKQNFLTEINTNMWLNTSKETSCLRRSKSTFCYFLNGCSFSTRLLKFGNLYKILAFWQFKGPFLPENTAFAPNTSSNLKIKYWRFQNMWNIKIDFGIILWDILTSHPHNSKSSLPITGTFWYVESYDW